MKNAFSKTTFLFLGLILTLGLSAQKPNQVTQSNTRFQLKIRVKKSEKVLSLKKTCKMFLSMQT